jgi:uncharacterized protein YjiS (DUF1127 family)
MTALHAVTLPNPLVRLARWHARRRAERSRTRDLNRLTALSPHLLADIGIDPPSPQPRTLTAMPPPRTVA